jgi:hypothetical protein
MCVQVPICKDLEKSGRVQKRLTEVGGGSSANLEPASLPHHGSHFLHRCSRIGNSKRDLALANLKHDMHNSSPSSKKCHMRVDAVP